MWRPRAVGESRLQLDSKLAWAALTASSTSCALASGSAAQGCPSVGSTLS